MIAVEYQSVDGLAALAKQIDAEIVKQFTNTAVLKVTEGRDVLALAEQLSASEAIIGYSVRVSHIEVKRR